MPESLAEKLEPRHLTEAAVLDEVTAPSPDASCDPESTPDDPRLKEVYPFHFSYTDARGRVWEGDFVSVIPSIQQRAAIGAIRARLAGGQPFEALDPQDLQNNFVLANLSVFLRNGEGDRPEWARDLFAIKDPDLLLELWNKEVAVHEATFFGRE